VEIWNKVKSGELRVVLGARSSVFLPFQHLGLVICDEEHDASYKQHDPAPRYHGRDAAIFLASLFENAKVVLGSGTPSIESYYQAVSGKYGFAELNERYGGLRLPPIETIDTRAIMQKDRSKVMLSPGLAESIRQVLEKGRQVILFQNRRGYSPYQICSVCGWIPKCKNCDVSLNFHKLGNKLVCHYCGTTYPPLHTCAQCGSHHFLQKNFGTERIEEILNEEFPDARISRMDLDTVRGKQAHDVLIQQFEQQRIDILVGTQMVVKGLDFDHVDLVGILDADALLHFADFRVNERAFQLVEQVSGRAGRRQETGKVLVQTSQPQHPVLEFVKNHDFKGLYASEIDKRKQFAYPPFTRLIRLIFRHKIKTIVDAAAYHYAGLLQPVYNAYITGPAEPVVNRVRNQYLVEILLKLPKDSSLIRRCKRDLLHQMATLHQVKDFRSVTVIPDVDPV
jgi:primosomal protein N' (replication factor Y)